MSKTNDLVWSRADKGKEEFTPEELKTLEEFRKEINEKKLSCKEINENIGTFRLDDIMLLRFLIARDFKIPKALKMLEEHLSWRDELVPGMIGKEELPNTYDCGVYRYLCQSKDGVNVVLVKNILFQPKDYSIEEFSKYITWMAETSIKMMDLNKSSQHIWVFDLTGWSLRKDGGMKATKITKELLKIAQQHYPERLMLSLVVNAPFAFRAFWNIIYPFIDDQTRKKVRFGPPKTLLEYCNEEDIPEFYGGKLKDESIPLHPEVDFFAQSDAKTTAPEIQKS